MSVSGLRVRFWGVRGSIACGGGDYCRYGGNTSCIELRLGDRLVILDAGTGLRRLGVALDTPLDVDIFLTHTHVDHIQGIPFFGPLFDPESDIRIHAGNQGYERTLEEVLHDYMAAPLFPIPPSVFSAKVDYRCFLSGSSFELGDDIVVRTARLNHPNGATGYRFDYQGRSFCYVTDTEHVPGEPDQGILELIEGADLMVYDRTFTDEEFPQFVGWGHSTWQEAVRLCNAANVGRLIVTHHDPNHDDEFLDEVAEAAGAAREGTVLAREGLEVSLPPDGGFHYR